MQNSFRACSFFRPVPDPFPLTPTVVRMSHTFECDSWKSAFISTSHPKIPHKDSRLYFCPPDCNLCWFLVLLQAVRTCRHFLTPSGVSDSYSSVCSSQSNKRPADSGVVHLLAYPARSILKMDTADQSGFVNTSVQVQWAVEAELTRKNPPVFFISVLENSLQCIKVHLTTVWMEMYLLVLL